MESRVLFLLQKVEKASIENVTFPLQKAVKSSLEQHNNVPSAESGEQPLMR